jgi:hypothetical protein
VVCLNHIACNNIKGYYKFDTALKDFLCRCEHLMPCSMNLFQFLKFKVEFKNEKFYHQFVSVLGSSGGPTWCLYTNYCFVARSRMAIYF